MAAAPRKATARRTKAPGARTGDFVFAARSGPVPLPSIDQYYPSGFITAEFDDLLQEQQANPDLATNPEFQFRASKVLYRLIESGLPDEYRATFRERVSSRELGDLMKQWETHSKGVTPGK